MGYPAKPSLLPAELLQTHMEAVWGPPQLPLQLRVEDPTNKSPLLTRMEAAWLAVPVPLTP
jgi:hypothetical protein